MLNWLLDKLLNRWEKKCKEKMGGIPLLWVIYHPERPIPNIDFSPHPMFRGDAILNGKCKEMAEYMRDKYLETKED